MSDTNGAISPPFGVGSEDQEILRVWVEGRDGGMRVSLVTAFDDPSTWGIALVDFARHVARAYARDTDLSEKEALNQIREMFDAEWSRPTDLGQRIERH